MVWLLMNTLHGDIRNETTLEINQVYDNIMSSKYKDSVSIQKSFFTKICS